MSNRIERPPAWIIPKAPPQLEALFHTEGKTLKVKKNTILAFEGEDFCNIYYVVSGLCCQTFSQLSEYSATLCLILPGRCLGDIFTVFGREVFLRFEVLEDSVLKYIPKQRFPEELRRGGQFAEDAIAYLINKMHSYLEGSISNATLSPDERLAVLLKNIADDDLSCVSDGYIKIPYKITQALMADLTSLSRVSVNKVVGGWLKDGVLRRKDQRLWVAESFFYKM